MPRFPHPLRFALAILLAFVASLAAAATPAGTVITNVVEADFVSPATGLPERARSNEVVTVIQRVCAVSVTPDGTVPQPGQTATVLPGEGATFRYTLVNAGNDTFTIPVAGRVETGSAATPSLSVIVDVNANGVVDAGEPEVTAVTLAADATAPLLLVVDAVTAQGDTFVNLVAGCADGRTDENNVSAVRVGAPPVVTVAKTFTPALVKPGEQTTVTVTATNAGLGDSREVTVTDLLGAQLDAGLAFVAGSAGTSLGTLEYTVDGQVWTAAPGPVVRGLRARAPGLKAGETLTLTFRLQATAAAADRQFLNVASARTGAVTTTGEARLDVRYRPAVAIGPLGNPEAPEGSAADRQVQSLVAVGQSVCFDHTAKNTGDVRDTFRVSVSVLQGAATPTLSGADGQPLTQPFPLEPGAITTVRVCYVPTQSGTLEAALTIQGDRGTKNATVDEVTRVVTVLPALRKTVQATTVDAAGQVVPVPAGATVRQGDTLTYQLSVTNPYPEALAGVTVTDPLPAHLDFVSASDSGVASGAAGSRTVTWSLGTLPAGATRTVTVNATVSPRAVDGEALRNTFSMTSEDFTTPLLSNEVQTAVWNAQLIVTKAVNTTQVTYGDRVLFTLTITNASQTTAVVDTLVKDTPPVGLQYIPGTSTLNGAVLDDPTVEGSSMLWNIGTIPAGATVTVTYRSRVTPEAAGQLVNYVQVQGNGAGGVALAIASNRAQATTTLNPLTFAPLADVVGIVFVDRDRDGRYDPVVDAPVPRARVLLAGGREVVTDAQGRYSFLNVPLGTHALRLDPNTVPYEPLALAQDGGLRGTQTVTVRGLTAVDFPLAPLAGEITVLRRTTLQVGDLTVEKTVYVDRAGGYLVRVRIVTGSAKTGVTFTDPLPAGAVLKEGSNSLNVNLPAGETNLTYRFDWTGAPRAATTDPVIRWRD